MGEGPPQPVGARRERTTPGAFRRRPLSFGGIIDRPGRHRDHEVWLTAIPQMPLLITMMLRQLISRLPKALPTKLRPRRGDRTGRINVAPWLGG